MTMAESLGDAASLRRTRGDAAEVFFPVRVLPLTSSFGLGAKAFASTASGSHEDVDEAGQLLLLVSAFVAVAHESPSAMFLGLRALSAFLKRVDSARDGTGDSALPFLDSSAVVAGVTALACDVGERIAWCTSEVVEVARGRANAKPVQGGKPLAWVLGLFDNLFEGIAELLRFARKSSCRHAAVARMERRRLSAHPPWRSATTTSVGRSRASVEAGAAESRAAISTSAARLLSRFLLLERATRSLEASVVSSEGGFARQASIMTIVPPEGASSVPSEADMPPPRQPGTAPPSLSLAGGGGGSAAPVLPPMLQADGSPLLPSLADAHGPGHRLSWDQPVPGVTWSDVGAPGWATAGQQKGDAAADDAPLTVAAVCVASIGSDDVPCPTLAWVDMARRLSAVVLTGVVKAASSDPPLFALLCTRHAATALCDVLDDGRSAYRFAVLSAGALHGTPRTGPDGPLGSIPPRLSALARRKLEAAQIIGAMGRRATHRAGAEAAGTSVLPLRRWFVAARRALRRSLPQLPVIDSSDSTSYALLPPCEPGSPSRAKPGRVTWAAVPNEDLACLAETLSVFMESMDENKAGAAASAGSGMAAFCVRILASILQLPLRAAADPSSSLAVLRRRVVSLDQILQSCLFAVANTAMVPAARSTLHAAGAFAIAQAAIVGAEVHTSTPTSEASDDAELDLVAAAERAQGVNGARVGGGRGRVGPGEGESLSAFLERAAPGGQRMWHAALLPMDQPDRALRLVQLANVMGCIAPVTTGGEGAFVGRRIALRVAAELASAAVGSSDTSSAHEVAFTVWTLSLNEKNRLEFVRAGAHHSLCTVVADEECELETRVVAAHALARLAPRLAAPTAPPARRRRTEASDLPATVGEGKRAGTKAGADLRTVVGKRMLLVKAKLQAERLRARQTGSDWLEDDEDDDTFAGDSRSAGGGLNIGSFKATLSHSSDSDSSSDSDAEEGSAFAISAPRAARAGAGGPAAGVDAQASHHRVGVSGSRLLAPTATTYGGSTVHWSRNELLGAAMASSELGMSISALANAVDGVLFACSVDLEHYTSSRLRSILLGHGDAAPSESEFSVGLPAIGPSVSQSQPQLHPLPSVPEDEQAPLDTSCSDQAAPTSVGFNAEAGSEGSEVGDDEDIKMQVVRPPPAHVSDFKFDVMISYSWARLETPRRVAKGLVERGFRVWLDVEQMHGSLIQRMAEAITHSRAVIVFRCPEYVQSTNCQRELEFAAMQRRAIVPVLLEPHSTENWLGLLIGSALYLDMRPSALESHGDSCYEYSVSSVVEQLSKLGVFPSGDNAGGSAPRTRPEASSAPAPAPAPAATPAASAQALCAASGQRPVARWAQSAAESPLLRAVSGVELATLLESNGFPRGDDCAGLTGAGLRVVLQLWEADSIACMRLLLSGDLGVTLTGQRLLQLVHAAQLAEMAGSA